MKLDTKTLRYLTSEDWQVLTAVETGSRTREIVPTHLITRLAGLGSNSGVNKSISTLVKANLISGRKHAKANGYRLTYGGLDYLALYTHMRRGTLYSTGNCIGVGKESDIHVVASSTGAQFILKIHRLGRISFRSVKNNRDYLKHHSSASWMHMSRLSALKEFAFMKALKDNGFRVPEPVAQNRHTVVMELIDAFPLRQIQEVPNPAGLYAELIDIVLRLATFGLIHGDFNEFNILIREEETSGIEKAGNTETEIPDPKPDIILVPVIIDFPQMVSIDHTNAEMYFDRDIDCIKRFFERRFKFLSDEPGPFFADAKKLVRGKRLDIEVEASGFSKQMAKELENYMQEVGVDRGSSHDQFRENRDDDSDASSTSLDEEASSNDWSQDPRGTDGDDGSLRPSNAAELDALPQQPNSPNRDIARVTLVETQ